MQHVRGCRILDQLRKERALTEVLLRVEHVGLLTLILTLTLTLALALQATCALSMSSPPKMSPNKFISGCGRGRGRGTALIKDAHATEFSPGATVAVAGRRRMCRDFRVPSGRGRTSGPRNVFATGRFFVAEVLRPSREWSSKKALFFLHLLSLHVIQERRLLG